MFPFIPRCLAERVTKGARTLEAIWLPLLQLGLALDSNLAEYPNSDCDYSLLPSTGRPRGVKRIPRLRPCDARSRMLQPGLAQVRVRAEAAAEQSIARHGPFNHQIHDHEMSVKKERHEYPPPRAPTFFL